MDAHRVPRKVHTVFAAKAADGVERAVTASQLWEALCAEYPELAAFAPDGVGTVDLECGHTVRWSGNLAGGAFACEVMDPHSCDSWEAFLLHVGASEIRTGWKRRGSNVDAPKVWEEAAMKLQLGEQVHARHEPNFLALAAAMAGTGELGIVSADMDERVGLETELAHWRSVAARQASMLRTVRQAAAAVAARPGSAESEGQEPHVRAWALSDMQAWADENADRIVIMPRAISEAKKSIYEDAGFVYEVLELLAETYRCVKLSLMGRATLKAECDRMGLAIGGSVEPTRAGEAGGEYHVTYGGRRRFLDQHVGKGSSRDTRYALRVYFFWDDATKRVVVGWLPSHLSNSNS